MKKLIYIILFILLLSQNCWAIDISKLLFESAVETDRQQSYNWHFATKNNPTKSPNGKLVCEGNPFVAGTTKEEFDKAVDGAKVLVNSIENNYVYNTIMIIEAYTVIRNSQKMKKQGFPQVYTIAYSWEF